MDFCSAVSEPLNVLGVALPGDKREPPDVLRVDPATDGPRMQFCTCDGVLQDEQGFPELDAPAVRQLVHFLAEWLDQVEPGTVGSVEV